MTDPRTGAEMVVRSHQLKAKVNPIPKALRGMLGSDEFKVVVQAQWYRLRYSFEDAMSLTVRPPVMPDRIKIRGWQWAERVDDHNCNLCTKMEISVKIPAPGVGGQVEKGTANGMKGAYADQPRRVITYLAQRKAAGRPYDDPFVWEAERLAKEAKAKAESAMVAAPSMARPPRRRPLLRVARAAAAPCHCRASATATPAEAAAPDRCPASRPPPSIAASSHVLGRGTALDMRLYARGEHSRRRQPIADDTPRAECESEGGAARSGGRASRDGCGRGGTAQRPACLNSEGARDGARGAAFGACAFGKPSAEDRGREGGLT